MNCFGIDFGTTNSSAFELNTQQSYGDGHTRPLPSIVVIDKAMDRAFGGRRVWEERLARTDKGGYHVISSVKSHLGTDREWFSGGKRWTVPDVAAVVLNQLVDRAKDSGGIREAVFGIPVGMSTKGRRDLREAARLAGIQVNGFIKESTAALIRYWEDVKNCRNVAVFDWGGGTLDISVLELRGHEIHELAACGSPVAGDRIDDDLARFVHHSIMKRRGSTRTLEEISRPQQDDLRFRCELAKCALAGSPETRFALVVYDGKHEDITLTRADCETVIEHHVRAALDLLAVAISKASLSTDAVDEIIVIGGCSQLWLFRDRLGNDTRFRGRYKLAENPDWDVAHGAAVVQKNPGCFVLAESLSLQLSYGTYFDLVVPGDSCPDTKRTVSLALVEDAKAANIIIEHRNEDGSTPETPLQFSVPTQGFDLEEIRLEYCLTPDLTFQISGQSLAKNGAARQQRETGLNGGAIIDHEAPRERRFVAVEK